ncbi:secretogranin-3 isoform X3 [Entelurus aequoreus]|uniref:secretogranin-3 isoform X3 n=1 Tax=Entelurus aequoreus TaxID=161455 RepID=UPI002B1E5CED|nr:secretogranin-3 isoform X3 [Entelurus aequoreus]
MASKHVGIFFHLLLFSYQTSAFPTPTPSGEDQFLYDGLLTGERLPEEQIAEADNVKAAVQLAERKQEDQDEDQDDQLVVLSQKVKDQDEDQDDEVVVHSQKVKAVKHHFVPDDSDSTKSRRLAQDYDSTKNAMEHDEPETFRQVDGSMLTSEDIVQKMANKIYQEDDRGVFDRIVSKLLKLGLITASQADTLEYQVAEALQDLISKNAKKEVEESKEEIREVKDKQEQDKWKSNEEEEEEKEKKEEEEEEEKEKVMDEVVRKAEDESEDKVWDKEDPEDESEDKVWGKEDPEDESEDKVWGKEDKEDETEDDNEVHPEDGLQDLQYFPNFYRLLRSLHSDEDAEERETLITIMKTLIDFVKMMVKYGTITPEEGVAYLENLDAMIAMQTKNKLGKSLGLQDFAVGKNLDEDDNTKAEASKMQKEYENLEDSTKEDQPSTSHTNGPGKSQTYLEAIRKNIEWLKKHNKEEGREDYDLSKLKDFMDQQVDSYIDKGIIAKDEGDTIKRIYSSL